MITFIPSMVVGLTGKVSKKSQLSKHGRFITKRANW
jgi:hypothetical protein